MVGRLGVWASTERISRRCGSWAQRLARALVSVPLLLPSGAFRPPPRVESAVVTLRFRPPGAPIASVATYEQLVRSVFLHRRKMLSNALAIFAAARGTTAAAALERASLDGRRRPETLSLDEIARLAGVLGPA